ncbi:MAG TPA: hypothetical protein VGQ84_10340, partial [Gaiellaceae bacterium]|nr:hypothetical protein [Gaiellaceae bacterium]
MSIVQLALAGLPSAFPDPSTARTWKVWLPSPRPLYSCGELQAANAAASSAHWKVEPALLDLNSKLASPEATTPEGATVIVVSGGVASTPQLRLAGVASTL